MLRPLNLTMKHKKAESYLIRTLIPIDLLSVFSTQPFVYYWIRVISFIKWVAPAYFSMMKRA